MNNNKITNKIFNLLSNDKIKESILVLKKYISSNDELKMLVIQSARYTDIVKKIHLGTVDEVISSIEKNKIRLALIELSIEIEEQVEALPLLKKELEQKAINQIHHGSGDNVGRDKIIN